MSDRKDDKSEAEALYIEAKMLASEAETVADYKRAEDLIKKANRLHHSKKYVKAIDTIMDVIEKLKEAEAEATDPESDSSDDFNEKLVQLVKTKQNKKANREEERAETSWSNFSSSIMSSTQITDHFIDQHKPSISSIEITSSMEDERENNKSSGDLDTIIATMDDLTIMDNKSKKVDSVNVEDSDDDVQIVDPKPESSSPLVKSQGPLDDSMSTEPTIPVEDDHTLFYHSPADSNEDSGQTDSHNKENILEEVSSQKDPEPGPSQSESKPEKSKKYIKLLTHLVRRKVYDKLYKYQVEGLEFLLNLFNTLEFEDDRQGCVLADDMGLGKTIQTIVFVSTLIDEGVIDTVLIVAPNTLIANWSREFRAWYPSTDLYHYEGSTNNRCNVLRQVRKHGGVMFVTYGLLMNSEHLIGAKGREGDRGQYVWDMVIIDEAHKVKNENATTKATRKIEGRFKLAITGTPVQNNLRELWSIFTFCKGESLLGSYSRFRVTYEDPIIASRKKGASGQTIANGIRYGESLRKLYKPYFIRRTKEEVFSNANRRKSMASGGLTLPPKIDWIVWINLSANQIEVYNAFLQSSDVKHALMMGRNCVLTQLVVLKKICDHIMQLPQSDIEKLYKQMVRKNQNPSVLGCQEEGTIANVADLTEEEILVNSGKMEFLIRLLEDHKEGNHRTLVFSRSLKILDMIQMMLANRQFNVCRLDGKVQMKDRDRIINDFQTNTDIDVCLLTIGIGGVGLTLTAADRVVIFDPDWNPANDSQAIDRAYRIGQTKPVIVYRLITVGTIEEKIFRRQIFKSGVIRQMVHSQNDPTRYFTDTDLYDLFSFDTKKMEFECETFSQLEELHGHLKKPCPISDGHREQVSMFPKCFDISDNGLMFSTNNDDVITEQEKINAEIQVQKVSDYESESKKEFKQLKERDQSKNLFKDGEHWNHPNVSKHAIAIPRKTNNLRLPPLEHQPT